MKFLRNELKRFSLFKKILIFLLDLMKKSYMFSINKIYGVNKNKVVFISFEGRSYSDNPRAISEELFLTDPNREIVWLFNDPIAKSKLVPKYIRCVNANSLKGLKELATSKHWVDNFCKPLFTYKSRDQVYIQTWHGDRGFKKVLHDSSFVPKNFKILENKICDLALSASKYGDDVYKSAFQYSGEILKMGSPRNDLLMKNNTSKKNDIKQKMEIDSDVKILLYAPTLRRDAATTRELQSNKDIKLDEILTALEVSTKKKWVCIVRSHSAVAGIANISFENKKIINGNMVEDMSELLLVTDFLITDYSSSAGDFALLKKPIVLFQPDVKEYIEKDRSFYFELNDSPYLKVEDSEELKDLILKLNWKSIPQNCTEILSFYKTVETGLASKKVVEYIVN